MTQIELLQSFLFICAGMSYGFTIVAYALREKLDDDAIVAVIKLFLSGLFATVVAILLFYI